MSETKQSLTDRVIGLISSVSGGQGITPHELPELIRATARALLEVDGMESGSHAPERAERREELPPVQGSVTREIEGAAERRVVKGKRKPGNPVTPIEKSVTPDYLVCLEDGMKMKMLKRHLMTHYSMTPEEYRAKWGLPADYPMIAPGYAYVRSLIAKKTGFGSMPDKKKGRKAV